MTAEPVIYEYKVLGRSVIPVTVAARTTNESLHQALAKENIFAIEAILDEMGKEGWEPVLLSYPYIFRRIKQ